jgi:hypothetical protein
MKNQKNKNSSFYFNMLEKRGELEIDYDKIRTKKIN